MLFDPYNSGHFYSLDITPDTLTREGKRKITPLQIMMMF